MQEQSHRRYELRRRDLFDQAQLFDDTTLSPSVHIIPHLAPKSQSARGAVRVYHAANEHASADEGARVEASPDAAGADVFASLTPIITLHHSKPMMSPHDYYKHRCEELGVRTQRAVVDALMGCEGLSCGASKPSSSSNPVSPTTTLAAPVMSSLAAPPVMSSSQGWTLNLSRVLLGKRGVVPLLDTLEWIGMKRLLQQALGDGAAASAWRKTPEAVLPLVDVNVAGCGLTDVAVDCLLLLISQYFPNVESVDLSNNGGIGYRGGNAILEFITSSPWCAVRRVHSLDTSIRPATARTIDNVLTRRWSLPAINEPEL